MKTLQPPERVVESLLELRKELLEQAALTGHMSMILAKINSCLYSQYPHPAHVAVTQAEMNQLLSRDTGA